MFTIYKIRFFEYFEFCIGNESKIGFSAIFGGETDWLLCSVIVVLRRQCTRLSDRHCKSRVISLFIYVHNIQNTFF